MSSITEDVPIWRKFASRFHEEYICLKCKKIIKEKREDCPDCGGVMSVRIAP